MAPPPTSWSWLALWLFSKRTSMASSVPNQGCRSPAPLSFSLPAGTKPSRMVMRWMTKSMWWSSSSTRTLPPPLSVIWPPPSSSIDFGTNTDLVSVMVCSPPQSNVTVPPSTFATASWRACSVHDAAVPLPTFST